jgi:hypothetical protein
VRDFWRQAKIDRVYRPPEDVRDGPVPDVETIELPEEEDAA